MRIADIPLDQIDTAVLPRDRSAADPAALADLIASIRAIGLRHPVEVFGITPDADYPLPYGLISGHRRLAAFRALGHATIPALLCDPADMPAAMAAMVAENEVRLNLAPLEKGRFLATLVDTGHFPDAGTAIAALYPGSTRQHRHRLRGFHAVAATLGPHLAAPDRLTLAEVDRLATALRLDGGAALRATLAAAPRSHDLQWQALRPVLDAILATPADLPTPRGKAPRPRHAVTLRQGITLTRERHRTGWSIRLTGPGAKSPGLVDDIFDLVEGWLG